VFFFLFCHLSFVLQIVFLLHLHLLFVFPAFHPDKFRIEHPDKKNYGMQFGKDQGRSSTSKQRNF
jgi:hypothetical protein